MSFTGLTCDFNLANFDDTVPEDIKRRNSSYDNKVLLQYYRDRVAAGGTSTVSRFRLLLVGDGGVGKTTLSRRLQHPNEDPGVTPVTHGIETGTFTIADGPGGVDMTGTVTDFGGQAQYRRTHPVLFSSQAVFAVVWSPRSDKTSTIARVEQYVRRVSARAPGAPVVLVETHAESSLASVLDEASVVRLRKTYPCVFGGRAVRVDGRSGKGITELKETLKAAASTLAHVPERDVPLR